MSDANRVVLDILWETDKKSKGGLLIAIDFEKFYFELLKKGFP